MVEEGCFPDCLKLAKITPIYKSGNSQLCNSYRPISVLKNLSKIFERLLLKRLNIYLSSNNILFKYQYGFTAQKSTADACVRIISHVQAALRDKNYVIAVFYDFKKAFDTVDHNRLLFKLEKYGVRGCALSLFKSYLSNRLQCVRIKDTCSSLRPVTYGVPQGSLLGPVLFNLYINDLHYFLQESTLTHYADDTATVCSDVNLDAVFHRTQDCLNLFQSWANSNFLTLNTSKSNYLLFSPRVNECIVPNNLSLHDISLDRVHYIRYLGLILDDKLKYDVHISNLCSRLSRAAGVSFAIGNSLSYEAARSLYFSFTQSIISYLLLFWGSSSNTFLNRVQILQNKIVRNLFSDKINHINTTDLFYKVQILKVKDLYYKELGISIYKALHLNQFDAISESLRALNWTHNYNTRKINCYRVPTIKTTTESRHLIFQAVQFWNSLPLQLRAATSLNIFRNKLHKHLLQKYLIG